MSRPVTQDDLFSIMRGYERRLERLEREARYEAPVSPDLTITGKLTAASAELSGSLTAARTELSGSPSAILDMRHTGASADLKRSRLVNANGGTMLQAINDAYSAVTKTGLSMNHETGVVDFPNGMTIGGSPLSGGGTPPLIQQIGDGSSTSFVVNHSFGTRNVSVYVFESVAPYREVQVEKQHTSASSVTILTDVAPAANGLTVVIVGGSLASTPIGSYVGLIGNGSATSFTVTHGLGTRNVIVQVRQVSNGEVVEADMLITGTNTVQISGFVTAPATNALEVVVLSAAQGAGAALTHGAQHRPGGTDPIDEDPVAMGMQAGVLNGGGIILLGSTGIRIPAGSGWVPTGVLGPSGGPICRLVSWPQTDITVPVSTGSRLDQLLVRPNGTVERLAGTESAAAVSATAGLDARVGAATPPVDSLRLADALANTGGLPASSHLRDRRQWARGFYARRETTVAQNNRVNTENIDPTNLRIRIESTGNQFMFFFRCERWQNNTSGGACSIGFAYNGNAGDRIGDSYHTFNSGGIGYAMHGHTAYYAPAVGISFLIEPAYAAWNGQTSFNASSGSPMQMVVQEIMRPSVPNGTT